MPTVRTKWHLPLELGQQNATLPTLSKAQRWFSLCRCRTMYNGFTPYCISHIWFTLCHPFQITLMLLNNLTWSNNLEMLLLFQMWSSLFYHKTHKLPTKVVVPQETWSSWSFLPGRTLAFMTSSWLLNLRCLLSLLEWHVIFDGLITGISYVFIIFTYSKSRKTFKKVEENVKIKWCLHSSYWKHFLYIQEGIC